MNHEAVDLHIPDSAWEPCGGEDPESRTRLHASVCVNGVHHHLEAYEVKVEDKNGIDMQVVVDSMFESNFEGMCMASEPDGRYQTVEIEGREYVLCMTPFC